MDSVHGVDPGFSEKGVRIFKALAVATPEIVYNGGLLITKLIKEAVF